MSRVVDDLQPATGHRAFQMSSFSILHISAGTIYTFPDWSRKPDTFFAVTNCCLQSMILT